MKVEYSGIKRTIYRLEQVKKRYHNRFTKVLDEIANEGMTIARAGYRDPAYAGNPLVDVKVVWEDDYTVSVVAEGEAVMFIEFGSGTNWWQSPYADTFPEVVVPLGHYGDGHGDSSKYPHGWVYYDKTGYTGGVGYPLREKKADGSYEEVPGKIRTWGNPPANAMYHASQKMREKVKKIIERGLT